MSNVYTPLLFKGGFIFIFEAANREERENKVNPSKGGKQMANKERARHINLQEKDGQTKNNGNETNKQVNCQKIERQRTILQNENI